MINIYKICDIPSTDEGKVLIAAIAILTSLDKQDLKNNLWGDMVHPDDALERVVELANKIFYKEEWKSNQIIKEREYKLNKLL